jgi:hypothetical protein
MMQKKFELQVIGFKCGALLFPQDGNFILNEERFVKLDVLGNHQYKLMMCEI